MAEQIDHLAEQRLHDQLENEMESDLIAQEQQLQRGTDVPIFEQADGQGRGAYRQLDGADVITAGGSGTSGDSEADGETIGDPGRGTDASEPPMQDNRPTDDAHLTDDTTGSGISTDELDNGQTPFEEDGATRAL